MNLNTETLICKRTDFSNQIYKAACLEYPNIVIPNRSLAFSLAAKSPNSNEVLKIKSEVNEYNTYINYLSNLDDFWNFFSQQNLSITYHQAEEKYGASTAKKIFSLSHYNFETSLSIYKDCLFAHDYAPSYSFLLPDHQKVCFSVGATNSGYPTQIDGHFTLLWNWFDDARDFTYFLFNIFEEMKLISINYEDNESDSKSYQDFDCWDQARYCIDHPDENLLRCIKILTDMGYLKTYRLVADTDSPWFHLRGASNGSIGLAVLDMTFTKNKLATQKLKLILKSSEDEILHNRYILTNSKDQLYLSNQPALFGGHYKLKIYGKLDCPSAHRYIEKGQYIQNRIFFPDEQDAISAGYHPCSVCMHGKYLQWKAQQK